jgi:hypothetical protein
LLRLLLLVLRRCRRIWIGWCCRNLRLVGIHVTELSEKEVIRLCRLLLRSFQLTLEICDFRMGRLQLNLVLGANLRDLSVELLLSITHLPVNPMPLGNAARAFLRSKNLSRLKMLTAECCSLDPFMYVRAGVSAG